jgi:hypothetical protein
MKYSKFPKSKRKTAPMTMILNNEGCPCDIGGTGEGNLFETAAPSCQLDADFINFAGSTINYGDMHFKCPVPDRARQDLT